MNTHLSPNVFGTTNTNMPNNVKTATDQDMTKTTTNQKPTSPPNNLTPTQTTMFRPDLHKDSNSRSLPTSTSPTCPKAIDSSAKQKHSLAIYSNNIQGFAKRKHFHSPWAGNTANNRGAKGGVGIILSKDLVNLWIKSGSKIICGGTSIGDTMRFMQVDVKLNPFLAKSTQVCVCTCLLFCVVLVST